MSNKLAKDEVECFHCANVWRRGPSDWTGQDGRCCEHVRDIIAAKDQRIAELEAALRLTESTMTETVAIHKRHNMSSCELKVTLTNIRNVLAKP